jgi:hypothetical protein
MSVLDIVPLADFDQMTIWILTETLAVAAFSVEGFYAFHAPAIQGEAGRPMGGVSVLVAPSMPSPTLHAQGHNFLIVLLDSLALVAAYFSPAMTVELFIESLADIIALVPSGMSVLLAGDFNCRIDTPVPTPKTSCFLNYLNEVGLWLCSAPRPLTFSSHQGSSTIDLFATSLPVGSIRPPRLIEGRSIQSVRNHFPVALEISTPGENAVVVTQPRVGRRICPERLRIALAAVQGSVEWVAGDVEAAARSLGEAMAGALPLLPPKNRRAQPWFDAQCYEARSRLLQARILSRAHAYMIPLFIRLRKAYKDCLRVHRARWHSIYEQRLLAEAEAEPYKFGRRHGPRTVCPIPAGSMMAHFRDIAGGVSSAPLGPPPRR